MKSVFLVDDEFLSLNRLRNLIDWQKHGLTIVGEAYNGEEALEKIKDLSPDLAFIDVSMPIMDGVALMAELIKLSKRPEVIILSSYDDFEYVRQTLRMGAVDYLLKHKLNADQMLKALKQVMKKWPSHSDVKEDGTALSTSDISRAFLMGKRESEQLLVKARRAVSIQLTDRPTAAQAASIPNTLMQMETDFGIKVLNMETDFWVVVFFDESSASSKKTSAIMRSITDGLKKYHNATCDWAPFPTPKQYAHWPRAYRFSKSLMGHTQPTTNKTATAYSPELSTIEQDTLSLLAKRGNHRKTRQYLSYLLSDAYRSGSVTLRRLRVSEILGVMFFDGLNDDWDIDIQPGTLDLDDPAELLAVIMSIHTSSLEKLEYKEDLIPDIVRQAKTLIEVNINHNVTLERLAAEIHVNPTYLSRMFRQACGRSFTQYLNAARIDRAMYLLVHEKQTAKYVAHSVGYNNYNHFFRMFKEVIGLSPSEFMAHPEAMKIYYSFDAFSAA